ncbi:MAG: leucine-rich repeat protein [Eggerthellaceae bacterium]|nr:leucine-rich repeat protein [Eggerthellaceae bacterium]
MPKRALLSGYLFAIGAGNTVDLDDDSRKYIRSHAQKLLEYVDYDVTAVKGIVSAGLIGRPTAGKLAGVCAQAGRTEAATILADYAEATKGKAETSKRKTADEGSSAVQSPETLNFEILHGVLKKYKGEDEIVVIPGGISEIGSGAFDGCGHIKSVAFPKGVKKVGDWAFFNCTSLKEVHVPSLEAWLKIDFADGAANPLGCGARLFIGGKPLEEDLVIPAGVKSIGANAFTVWDSLRSVVIPDGVTRIGKGAFNECDSLQSVAIPDTVTRIGEGAFAYCCSLRSVAIPSGVTRICDSLFEGCESLEAVTIPEGVKTIGYRAFAECASLKCVTIPGSVTAIGEDAFNEAKGIKYLGARIPSSLNIGQGQVFLAPRMRLAEIKTIRIPKASAVAGYLLLAASGEVPEFDSDCCAYTGRHVKEIVELVEYDAPSMRLLLEKGLIGKPTAQKLAIECSAAGHTEAAALLMDFAGGKKKTRLEL